MTEYKIGDRVLYNGVEGTVVNRVGELYEVRLDVEGGRYLYADQMEPLKEAKGCMYCKHGEPLNDTSNSNFATAIECEENGYYIATEYDDGDYADTGYSAYIQYCPMCGRKLEVAE